MTKSEFVIPVAILGLLFGLILVIKILTIARINHRKSCLIGIPIIIDSFIALHLTINIDLHYTYKLPILVCMKTTLNIDEKIIEKARILTGVKEKTALVKMGLEALIARESAKRLAKLGGTEKDIKPIPRRRN